MRLLLISFLFLIQVACASTIVTNNPDAVVGARVPLTHHLFFWGWWEASRPVEVNEICGNLGWSKVHTQYSPLNILVGVITAGIYTPVHVDVYCRNLQSRK